MFPLGDFIKRVRWMTGRSGRMHPLSTRGQKRQGQCCLTLLQPYQLWRKIDPDQSKPFLNDPQYRDYVTKGEDHMSAGEQAYLITAIVSFSLFALTVFYFDVTTNSKRSK